MAKQFGRDGFHVLLNNELKISSEKVIQNHDLNHLWFTVSMAEIDSLQSALGVMSATAEFPIKPDEVNFGPFLFKSEGDGFELSRTDITGRFGIKVTYKTMDSLYKILEDCKKILQEARLNKYPKKYV